MSCFISFENTLILAWRWSYSWGLTLLCSWTDSTLCLRCYLVLLFPSVLLIRFSFSFFPELSVPSDFFRPPYFGFNVLNLPRCSAKTVFAKSVDFASSVRAISCSRWIDETAEPTWALTFVCVEVSTSFNSSRVISAVSLLFTEFKAKVALFDHKYLATGDVDRRSDHSIPSLLLLRI